MLPLVLRPGDPRLGTDFVHDRGDALTAIPVVIAFPPRSFEAEKIACYLVVAAIFHQPRRMDDATRTDMQQWTDCIASALTRTQFATALTAAGLTDIEDRSTNTARRRSRAPASPRSLR